MINAIIQQSMGLVQYGIDRRCATLPASQQWPGAEHTTSEAVATPTESGVLLCPNSGAGRGLSMAMLCGFGLGASVRKAGGTASDVCSTPSPSYAIEHADDGFSTPEGAETMTTVNTTTTPTGNTIAHALRCILREVTPGQRPYSGDSYLPSHLIEAARAALSGHDQAAHQHAHNAISTAAWHIARGEAPKALARLRRAQSHILASMEGGAHHG
jgi:hypothetical protein